MMIAVLSFSSCVYRSRGPAYDYGYNGGYGNGYGNGYRYRVPPPRPVIVVPAPARRHYNNGRERRYSHGRSNRNYSQYERSARSRY